MTLTLAGDGLMTLTKKKEEDNSESVDKKD